MSQTLSYTITVTAEQARAEVERLQREFDQSQSAAKALDLQIAKLEKDFVDLSAAVKTGGANVDAYRAKLASTVSELNRMRGTTQSFASTMQSASTSTRGNAMALLEVSRAVEDAQYGIAGIVNNIPGLVASLGLGAGVAGAASLAAVAINQIAKNFADVPDAADEAMKATIARVEDLRKELQSAQDDVDDLFYGADAAGARRGAGSLEKARKAGKAIFEPFGGEEEFRRQLRVATESGMQDVNAIFGAKGLLAHTIDQMARDTGERSAKRITDDMVNAAKAAIDEIDTLSAREEARRTAQALREFNRIEREKKEEEERKRKEAEAEAERAIKRLAKSLEDSFSEAVKRGLTVGSVTSISDAMNSTAQRGGFGIGSEIRKAQLAAISDEDLLAAAPAYSIDSEAQKALQPFRDEVIAEHETRAKMMASITVDAFSMVGDAIAAAASGQKDAWANLLGDAAKYTGDKVTLAGGEALANGLKDAATGNVAGATAGIGTGLALIAAGQAISVGGAAAVGALTGAAGGGGGSAARDPGAAPRRSSGAPGESGNLVVNVTYGVAGPLPEDTARAIARAVSTGDRRRGAR